MNFYTQPIVSNMSMPPGRRTRALESLTEQVASLKAVCIHFNYFKFCESKCCVCVLQAPSGIEPELVAQYSHYALCFGTSINIIVQYFDFYLNI